MKLLDNRTGEKAKYKTLFYFKETKNNLIFKFKAFHSSLTSFSNVYNDAIYNGDVCEIFIKNSIDHYFELEVAPNGTKFLSDIENIDNKIKGTLINRCFFETKVKAKKNKYIVKIILPKTNLKTNKYEFNAFRIETDGEKANKYLFALHPTLSDTFHKIKLLK